ncbi:response regulator [Roseibium litorale]|uniref:Response regulator n=1 Tax=Roseibium litorale TaxID=2803841 RepID=A0ABR9CSP3_9HYPH|nr:response regulator [Roseibium litorale]MBD8893654.1 response regulator [Roseibium litorale]
MNMAAVGQDKDNAVSTGKKILIAEDSPVTQDILKLLLTSKGYDADIARDGTEALKCLLDKRYALALMDFHMPGLNGSEVVAEFRRLADGKAAPVFVAMTADPAALLAEKNSCEQFAKVFPKPFDIDEVLDFIDFSQGGAGRAVVPEGLKLPVTEEPESGGIGPEGSAAALAQETARRLRNTGGQPGISSLADAVEFQVSFGSLSLRGLRWPEDVGPAGVSVATRSYLASGGGYDAVIVSEPALCEDLRALWEIGDLYLLPVIDENGSLGPCADVSVPSLPRGSVQRTIEETIRDFSEARMSVHVHIRQSKSLSDKVAASTYVRGNSLKPHYNANKKHGFDFDICLDAKEGAAAMAALSELGLTETVFFDRFHMCGGCRSVRMNVREECFSCRSPNLKESKFIHHFKCAYQAAEEDFRQGSDLVCPKCSRELRHFGVDYDKPGIIIRCQACGSSSSDTAVGFQCMDCGYHTDGEVAETTDVFGYALSEKGIAFVEEGPVVIGGLQTKLRFAELPLELVIQLNKAAHDFSEKETPFSLITMSFPARREMVSEHGIRLVENSRVQMMENIKNYFGGNAVTYHGEAQDYVLINRVSPENARANLPQYLEAAQSGLRIDLQARMTVFGLEDLFA